MSDVKRLIDAAVVGDTKAAADLLPLVYAELRELAASKLADERPGQTLQPTALVHEAYLRLVGNDAGQPWNGRSHFFAAAAEAMRRILIESARRKLTPARCSLTEPVAVCDASPVQSRERREWKLSYTNDPRLNCEPCQMVWGLTAQVR